jgi:phosphoribosylformylglycinamidine cyclo-ligase
VSDFYKIDGVDVEAGDDFSAIVGKAAAATHDNCPYLQVLDLAKGNFRGPRPFRIRGLPVEDILFDAGPDGVGTKVVMHDAMMMHRNAPRDLLAMTCGDITRFGGLPVVFWNVLDVRNLGGPGSDSFNLFVDMLGGLVEAANEQGLVVHKGETAELGQCVGTDNPNANAPFNWAGVAFGVFMQNKIIYGDRVRPGDIVIALKEDGFRSNGISSVRVAFKKHYGPAYYSLKKARKDLELASTPSVLYDKFLATANGWYTDDLHPLIDVRLIAHITGGGIGKFVELLTPTGLSANLSNLFDLPPIMRKCAEWRGMNEEEVYTTWNGGQGVLAVIPDYEVTRFIEMAGAFGIDAKLCGEIFDSQETSVDVYSRYNARGALTFLPHQR